MEFKNQSEMFNYIWENREHISEVSGKPLLPKGHSKWHWQFAHVLGKGRYTKWKLKEFNIMLMLPEEHEKQERYPLFIERKGELELKYHEENKLNNFKDRVVDMSVSKEFYEEYSKTCKRLFNYNKKIEENGK